MSGSLGTWPISPAANPANPAPSSRSVSNASREPTGTSFALGRAYMSTNCAKTNSTPRSCMSFHALSAFHPMREPPSDVALCLPASTGAMKVRSLHRFPRLCVRFRRCAERLLELHHLHGDLDHEPVVAAEVEAGELADAAESLAQRVRVHEERLGSRADVPVAT